MQTGKREVFNEINITPLTDIFLVLLIIMMVVAPMLDFTGLKMSVPTMAPASDVTEDPKIIKLQVSNQDSYSIDNSPVAATGLAMTLQRMKAEKPEGILIETDPESSHEALARAMDAAQQAGIDKVAVSLSEGAGGGDAPAQ